MRKETNAFSITGCAGVMGAAGDGVVGVAPATAQSGHKVARVQKGTDRTVNPILRSRGTFIGLGYYFAGAHRLWSASTVRSTSIRPPSGPMMLLITSAL